VPAILRVGSIGVAILTRNEHELPHLHIEHPDKFVVVLLDEKLQFAHLREASRGIRASDVRNIVDIVDRNFDKLLAAWESIHR
jgi:hypothetical protein